MSEMIYAGNMPVLALRGLAIFPDQTVHFDVGRPKSALALEAAMKENQTLFLTPQKDIMVDDPQAGRPVYRGYHCPGQAGAEGPG